MNWIQCFLMFLGRISIGVLFVWAASDKLLNWDVNSHLMASKGISLIPLFLIGAFFIELFGGISLLLGYRIRFGALLLLIYLVPTALIFHDFWMYPEGQERYQQTILFLETLGVFGGLLYVLACGGGCFAIDNKRVKSVDEL